MTVTAKEQASSQETTCFLREQKVHEVVCVDDLAAGTHVMSGRWVDTMKTPTVSRSKCTAKSCEEPQSDEGCFAATSTIQLLGAVFGLTWARFRLGPILRAKAWPCSI